MKSNEQIREEASQVLQGEDFQRYLAGDESLDLGKWLAQQLNWKFSFEADPSLPPFIWQALGFMLKGFFLILGLILLGYLLRICYRRFFTSGKDKTDKPEAISMQREVSRKSYNCLASEALLRQDYRQAMHYLFLAAMSSVIRDTLLQRAECLTNREIATMSDFSRFPHPQKLCSTFNKMVLFDEYYWFGEASATQADYEQFAQYCKAFNEQVSPYAS